MAEQEQIHSRFGRRRGLRVLAFGLVLLGVCVFAWGLRYKLSLYYPPHSVAHRMPEAKLLTGRDRSAVPAADSRQAAPNASFYLVTLALTFFVLLGAKLWSWDRWELERTRLHAEPGDACIPALLNRPPPCLL